MLPAENVQKIGDLIDDEDNDDLDVNARDALTDQMLAEAEPQPPLPGLGGAQSHVAAIIKEATATARLGRALPTPQPSLRTEWDGILEALKIVLEGERDKICELVNGQQPNQPLLHL